MMHARVYLVGIYWVLSSFFDHYIQSSAWVFERVDHYIQSSAWAFERADSAQFTSFWSIYALVLRLMLVGIWLGLHWVLF